MHQHAEKRFPQVCKHIGQYAVPFPLWMSCSVFALYFQPAQSTAGIKEPENRKNATVWKCSKKPYLCFSCPKPLVTNLSHLMCRCVWVWNMLSLHGKDSALFLLTGRIKCLARFGTIFKTQSTYKTDSEKENKEQLLLWASCGFVCTMTSSFRGYEQLCQSQYRREEMSQPLDKCGVSRGAFRY